MELQQRIMVRIFSLAVLSLLLGNASHLAAAEPRLLIWEWDQLTAAKAALSNPTPELKHAVKMLRKEAGKALHNKSYSVTYNEFVPPSGDKHDYASFGAYWWPDPTKEDGLPFIRRDGVINKAQKGLGDRDQFGAFSKDVEALSLAYFIFEDEKYAEHAIHLIDDWFLNAETRMNPHLRYAQAVLGRSEGKNSGIIDTRDFISIIESLELLKKSPAYGQEFENGMREWFTEFLHWLRTSDLGKKESQANNNHGSWYQAQAMRIALYLDDQKMARDIFNHVRKKLISGQIMTDGTQPEELARTNTFHYSIFNLHALGTVARIGESLDEDLWHYHDQDGKGMQVAAEYLLPFVKGSAEWPHEQITEYHISPLVNQFFRMLSTRYREPGWLKVSEKLREGYSSYDHSLFLTAAYQEKLQAD
jgi:hypothetical protein